MESLGYLAFNWNYLRARGEYGSFCEGFSGFAELPPRTRRIHNGFKPPRCQLGTTSAHAENTGYLLVVWR